MHESSVYLYSDPDFSSLFAANDTPQTLNSCSLQWVTKWVDYSNKYGFGYQLSDHTVGVLFNNGTHMSLLPDRKYAVVCAIITLILCC